MLVYQSLSPEEASLNDESKRLVRAVARVLERRLELTPGGSRSERQLLQTSVPSLNLRFSAPSRYSRLRAVSQEERLPVLRAFVGLAAHSQRLHDFPKVKGKLWRKVDGAHLLHASVGVYLPMLLTAESPRLMVYFGSESQPAGIVSSSLMDALRDVLLTPGKDEQADSSKALGMRKKIALGLSFTHCQLDSQALLRIQSLLDSVFADPTRQCDIDVLDLSHNAMAAAELAVVADMVQKINAGVYSSVKELCLDNVIDIPDAGADGEKEPRDSRTPADTSSAFLQVVRKVLGSDRVRVPVGNGPSTSTTLASVSLSGNSACPLYFASVGSTLRYGSPVAGLLSTFQVQPDDSLAAKEECWRWLAFALFYPRLKRFGGGACKLSDLGRLELSTEALATFERTLRDPVAELVYGGGNQAARNGGAPRELMVCTVRRGAQIALSGSRGTATDERVELEALYDSPDGRVCVVVPGSGVGWVRREDVERLEREPVETRKRERYGVTLDCGKLKESLAGFDAVLSVVGPHVAALNLTSISSKFDADSLDVVLKHATKIRHLELRAHSTKHVLAALSGKLGESLLSLRLSGHSIEDADFQKLTKILDNPERPPALQELRLIGHMDAHGVSCLHELLSRNRTIRVVEMYASSMTERMGGSTSVRARERFRDTFDGQLLQSHFPVRCKLAFISAMATRTANRHEGGTHLDQWLLQQIFAFAESEQVHRTIFWHGEGVQYKYS